MYKLIPLFILLNCSVFAADFDEKLYRNTFEKMSSKEAYNIGEQKNISDEYKAAAYYRIYMAFWTTDRMEDAMDHRRLIFSVENNVSKLQTKYPSSLELINLRFSYMYLGRKRSNVVVLAFGRPIVIEAELLKLDSIIIHKIRDQYYNKFYYMIVNYELKLKTNSEIIWFQRTEYLFNPNTEIPTKKDIAMWKSMVINYGKIALDQNKWLPRVKRTEAIAPGIKPLSKKEAYIYAGQLLQPQLQRLFEGEK